ncbi:MAG TPA: DUF202 domain-containing protein [Nevskiaceae bacterium]|nr:DUF202 domain-containing protein [Nevskiaceae bacterium]
MGDPRVYFAAERTLLAWVRSGIAISGLGFVVSRFGLYLRLLALPAPAPLHLESPRLSAVIGAALVGMGAAASLLAALQFRGFIATLPRGDLPQRYHVAFAQLLAYGVAAAGALLCLYLAQ